MKTAYLDCFSGISGDMTVGALIDLGLPLALIEKEVGRLPLKDYRITLRRTKKNGISSADFGVDVKGAQHGRNYRDIRDMLSNSSLGKNVKELSLQIFKALSEAEGKVHGVNPEDIHFHEVGAVDSIIDIVATTIGVDYLGIGNVFTSRISTGSGMVAGEHGNMPVPAPATAELLKGIPFSTSALECELVTPTGAAIVKTLSKSFGAMPAMKVEAIGYGAGDRDLEDRPNLLRIFLGTEEGILSYNHEKDQVIVMEASIDDMNPQFFEPLIEDLFAAGCVDVAVIPVQMKKGRPASILQVLLPPHLKDKIAGVIFSESTSIGVRCYGADRIKLKRREEKIDTPLGEIRVKVIVKDGAFVEHRPEYEDMKRVARENNLSIIEASRRIQHFVNEGVE